MALNDSATVGMVQKVVAGVLPPKIAQGANYLAKQLKINTSQATTGFIKIGTVPFNSINTWQCYNCIMLISGIFRGSDPSTGTPMPTGQIEIETRKYSSGFSTSDTKVGILFGDIQTSDIFYVFESNNDISVYFNITGSEQVTVECEILSEQTGDLNNPNIFVFDGQTELASAPSNATFAVTRNMASGAQYLSKNAQLQANGSNMGWFEVGNVDLSSVTSGSGDCSIVFLINGLYPTPNMISADQGGILAMNLRVQQDGIVTTQSGLLCYAGNLIPSEYALLINGKVATLYTYLGSAYEFKEFLILSERGESTTIAGNFTQNNNFFNFNVQYYATSLSSNAIYAVIRNGKFKHNITIGQYSYTGNQDNITATFTIENGDSDSYGSIYNQQATSSTIANNISSSLSKVITALYNNSFSSNNNLLPASGAIVDGVTGNLVGIVLGAFGSTSVLYIASQLSGSTRPSNTSISTSISSGSSANFYTICDVVT